jgi:catechol 2,3-dioxygenase-like lactoylglutathione lyase family enzyme
MTIDHVILKVNDVEASVRFYVDVLGFTHEGEQPPFTVVRVGEDFVLQLAPWGTAGGDHLAFALPRDGFDAVLARVRERQLPYGGAYRTVGENGEPGVETGARGPAPTVYFFDPSRHLIEIRTYA